MAVNTLQDLYQQELGDLISANEQMQKTVDRMASKAQNDRIKQLMQRSVQGIQQHTATLRTLLQANVNVTCRAMQGIVEEAMQHTVEADLPPELRDVAMIAHFQRMSHYGTAGFGTAAAYAKALGQNDEAAQLSDIVTNIYNADEYATGLAEGVERALTRK